MVCASRALRFLVEEIDEGVDAVLARPIEGQSPYLWIDATCPKVRNGGRIVSTAASIAVGVDADGRREVLGMDIGPSEAEVFRKGFPAVARRSRPARRPPRRRRRSQGAVRRRRRGVPRHAAEIAGFIGCATRWPMPARSSGRLKTIFARESTGAAREQWHQVADALRETYPKLAAMMDDARGDVLAGMDFPRASTGPRSPRPARSSG